MANANIVLGNARVYPPFLVPAASTRLNVINTATATQLFVVLTVAVASLTNFTIAARPTQTYSNTAVTLYSTSADFTSPTGLLIGCSGDLTTQAAGTGWFIMDVRGMYQVELYATSGGTATIAVEVGIQ